MKKKLSTLVLALALLVTIGTPRKANAGFLVAGAGLMSSGNVALGVTFVGFAMIIGGAVSGNAALVVLDQAPGEGSVLLPRVAAEFTFLQDQPLVLNSIATKIEAKIKTLDASKLSSIPVEVKLDQADVESILDQAIITDEQAQVLTQALM